MKKYFKRALSLVLSFVIVATGINITPIETKAAESAFLTNQIVLEDDGNADLKDVLYWKGQEIELSVDVKTPYRDSVTWTASGEAGEAGITILDGGSNDTVVESSTGTGYRIKQNFKIGENASGTFTIKATVESEAKTFTFTVQDSYMTEIRSTTYNDFSQARWTGDRIDIYIVVAADVQWNGFTSNNDLVKIVTEDASVTPYYGKGSVVYKAVAAVGDSIAAEKQEKDQVTITAQTGKGNKDLSFEIWQSAREINRDSIEVKCTECESHSECTHLNANKDTIYLDVDKPATLSFTVEGSTVDELVLATAKSGNYYEVTSANSDANATDKTVRYDITINGKQKTPVGSSTSISFSGKSGNMVSKEMNIVVYQGGYSDDFDLYIGNTKYASGDGIMVDQGYTGTLVTQITKLIDQKEVIEWESNQPGVVTINKTTGAFEALKGGEAIITAIVKPTASGTRGQKSTFTVQVQGIVPPDKIVVTDENGNDAEDMKLFVGDDPTIFTKRATKNVDGVDSETAVYYKDYEWKADNTSYIKITPITGSSGVEEKVSVTPQAKGSTTLYVKAGTVFSNSINLKVIAPAKSITIQQDGDAISSLKAIENRNYELTAVRNKEASEDEERIQWTSSDTDLVNFIDPETNEECDTYIGDTCIVNAKAEGLVEVEAKAIDLGTRSTASVKLDVNVEKSIPADSVVFLDKDGQTIQNSQENPYIIKYSTNTATNTISITAKGRNGELGVDSNDEFEAEYEINGVISPTLDKTTNYLKITALGAGNASVIFRDIQTKATFPFYIKVEIPATKIQFLTGNTAYTKLVVNKGSEMYLGQDLNLTPKNSTDTITWESSNPELVSVDEYGKAIALNYTEDPVTITATASSGVSATCQVTVVNPITSIQFNAKDKNGNEMTLDGNTVLYLNETMTVDTIILPADATDKYDWATSNAAIASIETKADGSCVITGKGQGTVEISANPRVQIGSQATKTSFKLTVAKQVTGLDVHDKVTNGTSVVDSGIDLVTNATLYAILNPTDSYDVVTWTAEPSDAVELTVVNNQKNHYCTIKKLESGERVTLTVSTSSGLTKQIEVRTGTPLSECTISAIPDQMYTGVGTRQSVVITDGDYTLRENVDYTIVHPNDLISAGTKELVIKGKGMYCESQTITYKIVPKSLAEATITPIKNKTYSGKEITIQNELVVKVGTKVLRKDTDYEVSYANNTKAGTATVIIKGIKNYTGTVTTTFEIDGQSVSNLNVVLEASMVEYTGAEVTPGLTIKDRYGNELKQGVDYKVEYSNNVNVSTSGSKASIKITGMGNYSGEKQVYFTIRVKTLKAEMVKLNKTDYTYNGKKCKPKVTVTNPETGKKLKANTDYTVTYPTDLVNKGIKKITIIGKGNYSGTVYAEYGVAEKITLKKPKISSAKNNKSKKVALKVKKVANAEGYEITYATDKKFTKDVKVTTSKKVSKTIKKLKKGKTYYFKVRAYATNSIGRKVYSSYSKVKKVKIKK